MTKYKLISHQGKDVSVQMFQDGKFVFAIPFDPDNTDYQAYLKWLDGYEQQFNSQTHQIEWVKTSEGNTPLPADE